MLADHLQFQVTKLMSQDNCKKIENVSRYVHNTSLCTSSDSEHGIATGDLGSPLISKKKTKTLMGIASWYSTNDNGAQNADVYTAIYPYLAWINKIINLTR